MDRLRAMHIFTRVVEARSLSKAAKALILSPSSVTTAIQNLEQLFGVRLLQRTTRQLALTNAGAAYYESCRNILADLEQAEARLRGTAAEPRGTLRVEIAGWIGRQIVLPKVRTFQDQFPDVELQINLCDELEESPRDRFDCAVYPGVLQDSSLVARRIGTLKSIVCAAPPYIARHGEPKSVEALVHHHAVGFSPGRTGRAEAWEFLIDGATVSVKMTHRLELNDSNGYVACGLMGLGLIRSPEWQVQGYLDSGALREVLAEWRSPPAPIFAIYPHRGLLLPTVRVFIDWVAKVFERAPFTSQARMSVVK